MSSHLYLTGMVLSAMPVGEYDKRISLLTRERGKVSGFVRGARRANNHMIAAANPFVFGRFEAYEGRNAYTFSKAEVENYFESISTDLSNVYYGSYFLEMAEYYGRENLDESERLKLLYQSLRALGSGKFSSELIKIVYELRTMFINGEYPNVYSCKTCGKKQEIGYFSIKEHSVFCREHAEGKDTVRLSDSVLYAMQFIMCTPIEKLYTFKLTPEAEKELSDIVTRYRKKYHGHEYKSEAMLSDSLLSDKPLI